MPPDRPLMPNRPARTTGTMTPSARCRLALSGLAVLLATLAIYTQPPAWGDNIAQLTPGSVTFTAPDALRALGVTVQVPGLVTSAYVIVYPDRAHSSPTVSVFWDHGVVTVQGAVVLGRGRRKVALQHIRFDLGHRRISAVISNRFIALATWKAASFTVDLGRSASMRPTLTPTAARLLIKRLHLHRPIDRHVFGLVTLGGYSRLPE